MKRHIPLLVLSQILCFTGVSADELLSAYGKVNLFLQNVDDAEAGRYVELKSDASRFGFKGQNQVTETITAFYQLEWGVDISDKSKSSDDNITSRNQYIGIKGNFGQVIAGRHDTPMKTIQNKIDLFDNREGDIKYILNGDVRANNIVQYSTQKLNDLFTINLAVVPGEDPDGNNDNLADGTSVSVTFDNKGLYLAAAFDSDIEGERVDDSRFVAKYNLEQWQFGLLYQNTDNGVDKESGFNASASFRQGKTTYKVQYADSDIWRLGVNSKVKYSNVTSIGADYQLGKKTNLFAFYTDRELEEVDDSDKYLGIGITQSF